jgi:CheY-like chemotaxis protein
MAKKLILVAEDDMDDRYLLQTAFQESGSDEILHFVENGVDALTYLFNLGAGEKEGIYPDLIILDLNMPKKNGKEVLEEIKEHPLFKSIPVIIYTTTKSEIEIRRCYELGANTYIVKPVNYDHLKDVVQSIRSYWLDTATIPA